MSERIERVFAGELNRSDLTDPPGGPGGQSTLITLTGVSLRRLAIVGALTEVEGDAGELVHARIGDPTGAFTLRSGRHNPAVTRALAGIEPPAFIAVTASLILPVRNPAPGIALLPEAVAVVDRAARDTWVIATADATLGRLERLAAALAGTDREPVLARAIEHYHITPSSLLALADMAGAALGSVAGGSGRGEGAGGRDPKELVLAFLAARPGEGIPLGDILAELARQGIGAEAGARAVNELLAEGECYMPRKGTVRLA